MIWIILFVVGCLFGRISAGWASSALYDMNCGGLLQCRSCSAAVPAAVRWFSFGFIRCKCGAPRIRWHLASTVALGGVFVGFGWLMLTQQCETVHEVQPQAALMYSRLPFHLSLIFLLWVATVTDFLDYVIPDEIEKVGNRRHPQQENQRQVKRKT